MLGMWSTEPSSNPKYKTEMKGLLKGRTGWQKAEQNSYQMLETQKTGLKEVRGEQAHAHTAASVYYLVMSMEMHLS